MLDFLNQSVNDASGRKPHAAAFRHFGKGRAKLGEVILDIGAASQATIAAGWLDAIGHRQDQAAFASLFRYYAPRIKTYLRRLGAEEMVAEELAQESMLLVWRKAAQFDAKRASASTWIFAIARNLRIDRLRREHRPEIDMLDPMLIADPAAAADDLMSDAERSQALHDALKTLPVEQSVVVTMSFFEDIPHSEIALRLGLPLGTVKSRVRLAMQRIRSQLDILP
jgi:RNA polymerase sigma-70 factor (ECF subfamily)